MSQELVTSLTFLLPPIVVTAGLAGFVVNDRYIGQRQKKTLLEITQLIFSLIAQNYMDFLFTVRYFNPEMRMLIGVYGYIVRPLILALFCRVVQPESRHRVLWLLIGVNTALYLSTPFTRLTFWIDEAGRFHSNPLNCSCLVASAIMLVYLLFLTSRKYRLKGGGIMLFPFIDFLIVVSAVVLDYKVGGEDQVVTFLTNAIVMNSWFYYLWLHLQFEQEHEKEIITSQRERTMIHQIQPHFVFNALEVIRGLYKKAPEDADRALVKLERYLRGIIDTLPRDNLTPFLTELEHTKIYLELEQLRFPNELQVEYDLACTDFMIPPLTLQPIVENAVRHGVRGKKSGAGMILIATRAYPACYEITVDDDGPGFDPDILSGDGKSHIGIANVTERLQFEGAELRIAPRPEGGTRAMIIIPKKGVGG